MNTVHFEYDPERLIEEVKKRRGLWDVEDIDYRSKPARYRLWTEIVKELMDGDVKLTKSDMRELELQLQRKWKSLRDCYQKYKNNKSRTKRPYIYYKHLQFLKTNKNSSQQGASSESDDGRTKQLWKTKKRFRLTRDSSEEEAMEDARSNDAADIVIDVPVKQAHANKPIDEFVFANVDSKSEYEDSDKMFLLSLLPYLKAVPDEYRLNVKMDLMQVLRNASYNINEQKHIL